MTIRTEALSYTYLPRKTVLYDIYLSAPSGQATFILGANGSGKTTLLECLNGVRKATAGIVTVDGRAIDSLLPRARAHAIGYVPQIHEPIFAYTVWEVTLMGRAPHLGFLSRPTATDREKTAQALKTVGLWKLRDRPYTAISGGERRLVLIARGLAQEARYLLMDEPDAHLDPFHQHQILRNVLRLTGEGFTAIISSHNPNNALLYADRVILLSEGKVLVQGTPEEGVTTSNLQKMYGMEFDMIEDSIGRRAVLPMLDTHAQMMSQEESDEERGLLSKIAVKSDW